MKRTLVATLAAAPLLFVMVAAQISCPDETGPKSFVQAQLASKTSCQEVLRDECLFIHEARDKCPCLCQRLIVSDAQPAAGHPDASGYAHQMEGHEDYDYGDSGGARCFPAEAIVQTSKGPMTMEQLKGEREISLAARDGGNRIIYSPLKNWIHANGEQYTQYVDVVTESGHHLSLTELHLIYQSNCNGEASKAIMAKELSKGSCLTVADEKGDLVEAKIVMLSKSSKRGFYSPITEEGNMIVDGVVASCYSTTPNEPLQKIVFNYISLAQKTLQMVLPESIHASIFGQSGSTLPIPNVVLSLMDLSKYTVS